jgi:polyisoprenoid-binding protein YceI
VGIAAAQPGGPPNGDELAFIAHQMEAPLAGNVGRFLVDVHLDPARPQAGRVRIVIDTASVSGGSRDADTLLRGVDFFDVARFPQAVFESSGIHALEGGRLEARGTLSIKGHSAPLALVFRARPDAGGTWFEGDGEVSRLALGIGEGQWSDTSTLDDSVTIHFRVHAANP